jgi:transposase
VHGVQTSLDQIFVHAEGRCSGSSTVRPSRRDLVQRTRVVLLSAGGISAREISARLDPFTPEAVSRIRRRYKESGVKGLFDRPVGGREDHTVRGETIERMLQLAMSPTRSR